MSEIDAADVRAAVTMVDAHLRGDMAGVARVTTSTPSCEALLDATCLVAATLARGIALYGEMSASTALSLVELDTTPP